MHYSDLSLYLNTVVGRSPRTLNVGWIDSAQPFNTGKVHEDVLRRLVALCNYPVLRTAGFHVCRLCQDGTKSTGNGEIRILADSGMLYVSPCMISHYISEHSYLPPDEFIEAVHTLPLDLTHLENVNLYSLVYSFLLGGNCRPAQHLVKLIADEPNVDLRAQLYATLLRGGLGFRVVSQVRLAAGPHIVKAGDFPQIPTVSVKNDQAALLTYCAVGLLSKTFPLDQFAELKMNDLLRIALCNSVGIVVQDLLDPGLPWVCIPLEHVKMLLSILNRFPSVLATSVS